MSPLSAEQDASNPAPSWSPYMPPTMEAPALTLPDFNQEYTPAQKMWPGLLAGILAAIALGLCAHTAWSAWRDHQEEERNRHAAELETLQRRPAEPEEKMHYAGGYKYADEPPSAPSFFPQSYPVSALSTSSPANMSPAITVDNTRRESIHVIL